MIALTLWNNMITRCLYGVNSFTCSKVTVILLSLLSTAHKCKWIMVKPTPFWFNDTKTMAEDIQIGQKAIFTTKGLMKPYMGAFFQHHCHFKYFWISASWPSVIVPEVTEYFTLYFLNAASNSQSGSCIWLFSENHNQGKVLVANMYVTIENFTLCFLVGSCCCKQQSRFLYL